MSSNVSSRLCQITLFAGTFLPLAGCSTGPSDPTPIGSERSALQAFEQQDVSSARAAYATLEESQRLALWRAQLERNLERTDLRDEERSLLVSIRDTLPEKLRAGADIDAIEKRLDAQLGRERADELFGTLGDPRMRAPFEATVHYRDNDCNTRNCSGRCFCNDDMGIVTAGSVTCSITTCGGSCTPTGWGCGFLWLSSCTQKSTTTSTSDCGGADGSGGYYGGS